MQDRFEEWESTGVKIVPVLSQPDDSWKGERGYVQVICLVQHGCWSGVWSYHRPGPRAYLFQI